MLSERQLQAALKVIEDRMQALNEEYLTLMGEHIRDMGKLTPTDMHRLMQMKRLNGNVETIKRKIAQAAKLNADDVERIFRAAAESDLRFAQTIFATDHTPRIKDNKPLERILKAQLRVTNQTLANLSQTTIESQLYRRAVDVAVTAVQGGTTSYNTAIRRALKQAAGEGLRVTYPNSGMTRRLDTAVRQNILDGVRSLNQDILTQVGKDFGADGVEISAHALCAEDHLPYQGQQYSQREFESIQNSLERRIGTWNCKHTVHPILLGISQPTYSPEELEAYRRNSTEPIEIDGKTLTRYEWTQEQRKLETQVRYQKDIAVAAKASGDMQLRREAQTKIDALTAQYAHISDRAKLLEQPERMAVSGFHRVKSTAQLSAQVASAGFTSGTPIDWAAASNFASGDVRLTNMLRSKDAQQIATAVNEILNRDEYGFRESKWSGKVHVRDTGTMKDALGKKDWTCDISIRDDNVENLKTYIHENLHSRSASYFSVETFRTNRPTEEASVEYMAQQICKRSGIPFSPSYSLFVNALEDVRNVVSHNTTPYDFAKTIFDMDEDKRYTYITNLVNGYKINNPRMRKALRDRLNEGLRILAGIEKGGRTYG